MGEFDRKQHWENIYQTKQPREVSWFQPTPSTSLEFVKYFAIPTAASFSPTEQYDFWHDRAAFHVLTQEQEIDHYVDAAQRGIKPAGVLVIGTFSEQGAKKCSGLEIKQYSEETMSARLGIHFKKERCVTVDHKTPFDTVQNFIFCGFRRLQAD